MAPAADPSVADLDTLLEALRPGQRLLGLDVGSKTVGLALSDVGRTVATPLTTLKRGKFRDTAASLLQLTAEHDIGGFVVGLPLNMDGSEGPRAQATRAFGRNLAGQIDLPLLYWDERLSTAAAERALLEADASRAKRGTAIDKMAAAIILQGALDRLAYLIKESGLT